MDVEAQMACRIGDGLEHFQRPDATATPVMRVLETDECGGGVGNAPTRADRGLDLLGCENTSFPLDQRGHHAGEEPRTTSLGGVNVRGAFDDDRVARLSMQL